MFYAIVLDCSEIFRRTNMEGVHQDSFLDSTLWMTSSNSSSHQLQTLLVTQTMWLYLIRTSDYEQNRTDSGPSQG